MDDRWGRLGSTRALEVTRSAGNGWHPHLHVLLYFGEQLTAEQVVELTEVIYAAYRRGLERRGFSVEDRDADVVPGRYLAKIASKVTRQDTKAARGGVFMTFDLLRAVVDDDQAKAELWRECQKEFAP